MDVVQLFIHSPTEGHLGYSKFYDFLGRANSDIYEQCQIKENDQKQTVLLAEKPYRFEVLCPEKQHEMQNSETDEQHVCCLELRHRVYIIDTQT